MKKQFKKNIRIIHLGGLGEVGRNMALIEYTPPFKPREILIIDMGLKFADETLPGIDCIIQDISYLKGKSKNILGVLFTHGHYDHLGSVPYLIGKIGNPPIFASALTLRIISKRQDDFPHQPKLDIEEVKDKSRIELGSFKIEFFKQTHSIPDNLGIFIQTPVGNIIHTSDFKFDSAPVNETPTNFERLKKLSERKIHLLMSDSTGAEQDGHSLSESTVMENLEKIFKNNTKGKIVISTFASLINRIQQIITLSEKYGRYVAIDGYSMRTNVDICRALKYIKIKKGSLILAKKIADYPDSKITLICTGAQGEAQAILMKIANKEYPYLRLKKGDSVVFSSSIVPGNERTVQTLKDEFYRQKTNVFHYKMMDIHASGHGKRDELKQMIQIMKPKFFFPVHGQYSMLSNHAEIAKEVGIPEKNIIVADNGQVVNLSRDNIFIENKTVPADHIMIDGFGAGAVEGIVLQDRKALAKDGIFVIIAIIDKKTGKVKGSPDIISRGFVYLKESKMLLAETRKKTVGIINKTAVSGGAVNWNHIKANIRNKVGDFLFTRTQRRPMILPVVIEV